jgi:predicted nucleic acid-binding Zn ribbon protein
MAKKTQFALLKDLLPRTINHYNLAKQVNGSLVCHHFRKLAVEIWHDSIEETVRVKSFKEGVLNVSVSDAGWSQQVQFKKVRIMEGLAEACPEIPVKSLRVKVEGFSA